METIVEEIWKDIPGYEGIYQASNLGRVKSLSRIYYHSVNKKYREVKSQILKPQKNGSGYFHVRLRTVDTYKTRTIHQLIAITFFGHTPCGTKLVVDHINDIKEDNRADNLQIVTNRFNSYKTQGKYSSQYKGVFWKKTHKKWCSKIVIQGKIKLLGYFSDEYEAHLAYENEVKKINLN